MILLGIDTSSAATSVAVLDDSGILAHLSHVDARAHAEVLAPMIADVCSGLKVDAVVCGVGPGPYTGLRVGVVTAQTLGLAWQVPVVGVCSLDALGHSARESGITGEFIAALDARRGEVYWARYAQTRLAGPFVNRREELGEHLLALPWIGVGTDSTYPDPADLVRIAAPLLMAGIAVGERVTALADHGGDGGSTAGQLAGTTLLPAFPLYVRRPDAVASQA